MTTVAKMTPTEISTRDTKTFMPRPKPFHQLLDKGALLENVVIRLGTKTQLEILRGGCFCLTPSRRRRHFSVLFNAQPQAPAFFRFV